ncbi:MAG: hypothetical protein U0269_08790 [Polyangiales bacterium]
MAPPWTSALAAARTVRTSLLIVCALAWAHPACAPSAPKTSTVLPGHRATMDSLGYAPVGATEDATIRRGQTRSHLARLRAGHCYRIVALGASDGVNLEAALYTPDGVRAVQSLTSARCERGLLRGGLGDVSLRGLGARRPRRVRVRAVGPRRRALG